MSGQGLGDHPGRFAPGAGACHGQVGGDVAVLGVCGHLHDKGGQLSLGQFACIHGSLRSGSQQTAGLIQCGLPGVVVAVDRCKFSHGL